MREVFLFSLFTFLFSVSVYGQGKVYKNGIEKLNSTTSHHFGLFHLRINQNFKEKPVQRTNIRFSLESGNNFHPEVEAYLPKDPSERARLSQLAWYQRDFQFIDRQTTPADYMNIHIDAVFKVIRFDLEVKLGKRHELGIAIRSFIPTEGHYPFSFFTSDESLEWFHSNIAGGEDPFGRRFFGLNQMTVAYTDRNGRRLSLRKNQFIIAGLELNHFYYPEIFEADKNLYVNFGSHLGVNTSSYNSSVDIGFSANMHKKWQLKNSNEFRFGLGISGLRKGMIAFGNPIDFGNNLWMGRGEASFEFAKYTQQGNYHAFALNYQLQTRYNKNEERDYYFLNGDSTWQNINAGWHNGFSTLYETLTVWSVYYTYARKHFALSLYFQEDLKLNNAPDVQTGLSIKIPIAKH